ncbi:MAG: hypothetical protein OWQ52_04700 [Metallosphaera prunae]|uniref:hypothetical protein n=1 Tax=Metallosphaera prunae TaxID=47304 RepID=UPI0022763EBA|nr:hypothetical protein [Metallosphaera prunae]MCY0861712.1 hypothetical protein [Metallosphaera prunae]
MRVYGGDFIREMLRKLNSLRKVSGEVTLSRSHSVGGKVNVFSAKTSRIVRRLQDSDCEKILIFVDGDGQNTDEVKASLKNIVGNKNVYYVVFKTEIEEWIVPDSSKPSEYLKSHQDYDKNDLPKLAEKINFNLVSGKASFQDFLKAIDDP